jgi:hypothetical protein
MTTNEAQSKAEAAIAKAQQMLTANVATVVEMDRTMTDGRNTYTRNVGGVFSARTEAEFMLLEVFNSLPLGEAADDYEHPAARWMQDEAAKLGITLE